MTNRTLIRNHIFNQKFTWRQFRNRPGDFPIIGIKGLRPPLVDEFLVLKYIPFTNFYLGKQASSHVIGYYLHMLIKDARERAGKTCFLVELRCTDEELTLPDIEPVIPQSDIPQSDMVLYLIKRDVEEQAQFSLAYINVKRREINFYGFAEGMSNRREFLVSFARHWNWLEDATGLKTLDVVRQCHTDYEVQESGIHVCRFANSLLRQQRHPPKQFPDLQKENFYTRVAFELCRGVIMNKPVCRCHI